MRLLLAGAGGHGRVVAEAAILTGMWSEVAFLDDSYPALTCSGEWPVVGRLSDLETSVSAFDGFAPALGDARVRLQLHARAVVLGRQASVVIHPRAVVSPSATLGSGTVVVAGAVINSGAKLGLCCIVNTASSVDHDCVLGDGVHVCPGAHVAGGVTIGARVWFGIGAIAKQGIVVGADATVGAGAVCIRDVPSGAVVAGVPAREIRP